jgi:hypothetical protein
MRVLKTKNAGDQSRFPAFFYEAQIIQASASSLFSVACLLETCATRTCEVRGAAETNLSDPAGPPTRTGTFIAKNAAETIKKF